MEGGLLISAKGGAILLCQKKQKMVSIIHKELKHKVEKLRQLKLEVMPKTELSARELEC